MNRRAAIQTPLVRRARSNVCFSARYRVRFGSLTRFSGVNAEVNFPSCAEVNFPTLLDTPDHSELLRLGGRPRRFFGLTGAVMGGSRKFSGTSLACSLSR